MIRADRALRLRSEVWRQHRKPRQSPRPGPRRLGALVPRGPAVVEAPQGAPSRAADSTPAPSDPGSSSTHMREAAGRTRSRCRSTCRNGSESRSNASNSARRGSATQRSHAGCSRCFTSARRRSATRPLSSCSGGCGSRPARKVPTSDFRKEARGVRFFEALWERQRAILTELRHGAGGGLDATALAVWTTAVVELAGPNTAGEAHGPPARPASAARWEPRVEPSEDGLRRPPLRRQRELLRRHHDGRLERRDLRRRAHDPQEAIGDRGRRELRRSRTTCPRRTPFDRRRSASVAGQRQPRCGRRARDSARASTGSRPSRARRGARTPGGRARAVR